MTVYQDDDLNFTPVTDPTLMNELAEQAMRDDDGGRAVMPAPSPVEDDVRAAFSGFPDTTVELPAGLFNPITGDLVREAEVRELNGADEEALAKIKNEGKALMAMIDRGVVKLGGEPATPTLLDMLLIGDRDMLLLGIRKATFGDEIELKLSCPHCQTDQDAKLSITDDIPVRRHDDPSQRELRVETRQGTVDLELPTGTVQKKLIAAEGKTLAEMNTILLAACVRSVNGAPVLGGDNAVRRFGIADRTKLINAIADASVGPRLEEVKRTCTGCEREFDLPLSLSDLFRT